VARTSVHELLHNFGLSHAGVLRCQDDSRNDPVPLGSECALNEYGDDDSVMGTGTSREFPAIQRAMLGWIVGERVRALDSSGTVELTCGVAGVGLLLVPGGGGVTYAIEPHCGGSVASGAEVRVVGESGRTLLIDGTPDTRQSHDARFAPGAEPFTAPGGMVTMHVEERTVDRIAVRIKLDPSGKPPSTTVHVLPNAEHPASRSPAA
jgi:hypothetical protein